MNDQVPSAFIGSPTEGLDVAREVELQLQRDAITAIWKDGVFGPTSGLDYLKLREEVLRPSVVPESQTTR